MSKRIHIVFKPVDYHGHQHLLFIGVTDDAGLAIPDKQLEWAADGEYEQLSIVVPDCTTVQPQNNR